MAAKWIAMSGFGAGVYMILTAVGFHGLAGKVDEHHLGLWDTGCHSILYGSLSLGILGLAARGTARPKVFEGAGWAIALGCLLFAIGNLGFALTPSKFLFITTPIGAVSWILGAFVFGWAVLKDRH